MNKTILISFLALISVCQENLMALSNCLGNCAICALDQLSACSGEQYVQCVKGYNGTNCQIKPTFANQVVAMDPHKKNPGVSMWQNEKTITCVYVNSKLQQIPVHVLGDYKGFDSNQLTLEIEPFYRSFMISFNLVRGVWTPFSDLLRVAVLDQDDNIVSEHFLEFAKRDQINSKKDLLKCNRQPRLIEKYQIQGSIDAEKQSKLVVKFEGMMFSDAVWGLTNTKVAFGCSHFLLYNGVQCKICSSGYFEVKDTNENVVSCSPCPLNCTKCSSKYLCSACESGFQLQNGKCINKYLIANFHAPQTLICPGHQFQLSNTQNDQEKLVIQFSSLPTHKKARVIFFVAYNSKALFNGHKIGISIDGLKQKEIESATLNEVKQRPKQVCQGFGKENYFELVKFVSSYFEHSKNSLRIVVTGDKGIKIGVQEIQIQYDQAEKLTIKQSEQGYSKQNVNLKNLQKIEPSEVEKPQIKTNEKKEQKKDEQIQKPLIKQTQSQRVVDFSNSEIPRISSHVHKPSEIAKSIQKLQNNKWNIKTGLKIGKSLVISLYYPIQIQHFPYFVANLQHKNMSFIPRVLDKNKQQQQLHFDLNFSLLGEKIDLFMAEKPPMVRQNGRNLQQQNNLHLSTVSVQRFDHLSEDEWGTIERFSTFFQILAWATISSTITLCFLGYSVMTQKLSLLLQMIFLYTYIFNEYLPINFKSSIQGLHRMENLNYFQKSASESIEQWLLGNVIQASPTKFTIFSKDINFTRSVYPCIIINLVYLVWFLLLKGLRPLIEPKQNEIGSGSVGMLKLRLQLAHLAERGMSFWSQIWQYQYLVLVWSACKQLYNLSYPLDSDRSQTPNTIFCILCLIAAVGLPILTTVLTRRAFAKQDYLQYSYQYSNIFYLQLPCETLPTTHHTINIIVRNARYLLLVLLIAYLGNFPLQCLILLFILHLAYLLYTNLIKLEIKPICLLLNIMELVFLMILTVGTLIAVSLSQTLQTKEYMVIGSVLIVICLLLCAVSLAQVLYYVCNQVGGSWSTKQRQSISQEAEEGE